MPDNPNIAAGQNNGGCPQNGITEAVCIDTARVYDSCADRDCLSDLCVIFTETAQTVIESATTVRCRSCEVINVFSEIEKVPFSAGYYSVDATFFFKALLDAYTSPTEAPQTVEGLCVYSKKAILYGAQGSVKVFSSEYSPSIDTQNTSVVTNPRAKIQVATPICLDARLCTTCECCNSSAETINAIPESVESQFDGEFAVTETCKSVRMTIGLFSIIQLERDVQLLIPAYDFCVPSKECTNDTEDPCDAFRRISFPISEFFPPEQAPAAEENPEFPLFSGQNGCPCGK